MLKEDEVCQITNIHVHQTVTREKKTFQKSSVYDSETDSVTRLCCLCWMQNSCWLCVAAGDPRPEGLRLQLVLPDSALLPQQRWLQEEQHVQVRPLNTQ